MKTLYDSIEWLRVTLTSIGDAVITTDAAGHVTFLNPVAEKLTGWMHAEAVDHSLEEVFRIVNEETRKEVENPALRCLREGLVVGLANHTLLVSRDGTERPIDDSAAPIRNAAGQVAGAVLVFRDITERKRAELANARLAAIVESSSDAIISKDLNGIIQSWNRGAERLFGYTAEEAIGQPVTMLIPPDRIDEEANILARIGRGERIEHYETVRRCKDGALRDISLTVSPIVDARGEVVAASKVARDITERKRAKEANDASELRYRRLFESAKDGVLILDGHSGQIIDANAFMAGLVGLERDDLIGKELHEIGMFVDTEKNKEAFHELKRTGYLRHEHLPVRHRDGHKVEVEFIANMYHEDHTPMAQCNVRDISERITMQRRIADQAEAIASESRRKDEFLAMLSHELRNPLAPIRTAVHLLRMRERESEDLIAQQARDVIERQVTNLTRLVSDLLEISRVVSGRIRLELQMVDLNEVIDHALQALRPMVEHRGHELAVNRSDEPVWVNGDATRLEEVIINLLDNAAKYTGEGGRIEVWCEHPRGANYAQVRVRDNGVGIDQELLPRIFDLFTQADRSLAHSAGGLGIGLSLAHRLVDMHGGKIQAHSPPEGLDVGSEFIVWLPIMPAPAQPPAAPEPEDPANVAGRRVLVVDDNIDQVMMVSSLLRQLGYSVQSAYTGPEGLRVAHQWRPDVILLDIGLPGLDGYEVARRIRSAAELDLRRARLIALTGYGRDTDIALAREAGFDAHMVKPFGSDELQKLIGAELAK